jgi:hypothetical protein
MAGQGKDGDGVRASFHLQSRNTYPGLASSSRSWTSLYIGKTCTGPGVWQVFGNERAESTAPFILKQPVIWWNIILGTLRRDRRENTGTGCN